MGIRVAHNSRYKDGIYYKGILFASPTELYREAQPSPAVSEQTFLVRLARFRTRGENGDEHIDQALYCSVEDFKKIYSTRRTLVDIGDETIDLGCYYSSGKAGALVSYRTFWQRVRRLRNGELLTRESLQKAMIFPESDWITFFGGGRHRQFVYSGEAYSEHYGSTFRSVTAFLKVIGRYDERSTIWSRLKAGWGLDLALSVPVDHATERLGIVYKITRKSSGQFYVGITLGALQLRWTFHKVNARKGTTKLAFAIREDGENGFDLEVLEDGIFGVELLKAWEVFWVNQLGALGPMGLNMAKPGSLSTKPGNRIEVEGKLYRSHKEAAEVEGAKRNLAPHVILRRLSKNQPIPARARIHSNHPEAGSNLFRRWLALKKRHPQMVDEAWVESYDDFKRDIGGLVDPKLQLVRVDVAKPWGPENFKWITVQQKIDLLSGNPVRVHGRDFPSIAAVARHFGIGKSTLKNRINVQGMTVEEAVGRPLSSTSFRNVEAEIVIDQRSFRSKRQAAIYLQESRGLSEYKARLWVDDLLNKASSEK